MHVITSLKLQYFVWLKNKSLYPWYSFFIVYYIIDITFTTNWATTVLSSTQCYLCTGRQRSLHSNMTHVFLVALINMKRGPMMTQCTVGSRFKGALMIREKSLWRSSSWDACSKWLWWTSMCDCGWEDDQASNLYLIFHIHLSIIVLKLVGRGGKNIL